MGGDEEAESRQQEAGRGGVDEGKARAGERQRKSKRKGKRQERKVEGRLQPL